MSGTTRVAVVSIVQSITSRSDDIGNDTRLFHDLGIAGDDAAELFDKIAEEFGTRLDGLDFAKYFQNESEALLYRIAELVGYRSRKPPLTFGHLVRVVETGSWFEPLNN
jgi:hypothetical protein